MPAGMPGGVHVPFARSLGSQFREIPGSRASCPRSRGRDALDPGVVTNRTYTLPGGTRAAPHHARPAQASRVRTLTSPDSQRTTPAACSTSKAPSVVDSARRPRQRRPRRQHAHRHDREARRVRPTSPETARVHRPGTARKRRGAHWPLRTPSRFVAARGRMSSRSRSTADRWRRYRPRRDRD